MKPSTELFELIKSLTKSEKRFFKLSSSLQSGDKNYLKIFEFIDKQKEYDEDALKEQFKKEIFIKHLPSEKNHLYKLILKSLRAYHADDSISSILKQEIKNIEILYKKALYKECTKFLERAKKIAISYEKFYYWFELLNWQKLLLEEAYEAGEFTTDLDALIKEEQEVIEKLRNLAAYHVLYSKINYVFRSGGFVRTDEERALVNEISSHPLIKGKNTALSNRAATICYYIQGFCATANLEKENAYKKFLRVKLILDQNPLLRNDLPKRYIRTMSSLITIMIDLGMIEEARKMITEVRKLSVEKEFAVENIHLVVFKNIYLAELKLYQRTGNYAQAMEKVEEIVDKLDGLGDKINKEHELLFFYNLALVYFGAGEFNKSLYWLNKVLNDNENHLRQDIYSYARLFNLIVHYELENYDLLEYIIKSASRYLNKRQRDYELEVLILSYMRKLSKPNKGTIELMMNFKNDLEHYMSNQEDRVILEYFNYPAWITSKIEGISFEEASRQRFKPLDQRSRA